MVRVNTRVKRITAALCAFFMMIGFAFLPIMSMKAYAFQKDPHADTIYFIMDGSEQSDKNYSISYEITSGHELKNIVPLEKKGCEADMDAKAGDKISISYKVNYPQDTDSNKYSNTEVELSADSTTYNDDYEAVKTSLVDESFSASDGSVGTLEVEVPKDSDGVFLSIRSSYDWEFTVAGTTQSSGSTKMFLWIHVNVTGGEEVKEQEVEQHADLDSGEDEGTEIDQEIVEKQEPEKKKEKEDKDKGNVKKPTSWSVGVAVGGGMIGLGFAGALVGGGDGPSAPGESKDSKKQEDADNKKKRYKMYISKDFGDAIRKGATPVQVRARIMEIREGGGTVPKPELTRRISVSGENIKIGNTSMTGGWMTAEVYADANSREKEGVVIFTFNGDGGVFRNRVIFRLTGEPYIVFPDMESYEAEMMLKVIASDPTPYSCRFFFEDAIGEATKLQFSKSERFSIKAHLAENVRTYYADVSLNDIVDSSPLYTNVEREYVAIHAEFANGDKVDGGFYVEIWPDGISISSRHIRNGYLEIGTLPNKDAGDLDYAIRPTGFVVRLACRTGGMPDGKPLFLTGKDLDPTFGELYDVEQYGHMFTDNFKFDLDTKSDEYSFEPKHTMPQLGDPYHALMDINCEAGGQSYRETLTLAIIGEKPVPPDEWGKEWELLKKTIWAYGISPDCFWIRDWIRNAKDHTPNELSMLRYNIIKQAVDYYMKEAMEFNQLADSIERWEKGYSFLKWVGDQAFSYLISVYGGGPTVEAFASPLKDMFAEFAGVYAGALIMGEKVVYEESNLYKALMQGVENTLGNILTGDTPPTPQKVGYVIAAFIFTSFFRHYYFGDEEKGDIYKSLLAACGDLSGTYIKKVTGDAFKKFLKNDTGFGYRLNEYFKSLFDFDSDFYHPEAVEKYITETVGAVSGWIYDKTSNMPTPLNPLQGSIEGAKFAENSWTIRIELKGGFIVEIPILDNIGVIVDLFYEYALKPFGDNAKPVPVRDYMLNKQ